MSKIKMIPSTVSILEGGSGTAPELFTVIRWPAVDKHSLNQSEIDFLRKLLVLAEEAIDDYKAEATDYRESLWMTCDENNPETLDAFVELNKVKSSLKKLRKDKKTITSIFTKLKAQSKVQ